MGMGKSGHIADKLAATLASTGTPSFFVHPGEASHGDLGMISRSDVVVALSNSGKTEEIVSLLPMLKNMGIKIIAMTGDNNSKIATASDVHIDVGVEEEACPMNLSPTASTTAALAMGDAIAVALLEKRGFSVEDFAKSHPGGSIGKKLLLLVKDIMHFLRRSRGPSLHQARLGRESNRMHWQILLVLQDLISMLTVIEIVLPVEEFAPVFVPLFW